MEIPSRTCPKGGVALIGESPTEPFEHPDRYWDVTCTICGHVGTTGPDDPRLHDLPEPARTEARALASRHLIDGYRKPGIDPGEPWVPTPEELAAADAAVERQRQPGGKFYTGPLTPEEETMALDALGRTTNPGPTVRAAMEDNIEAHRRLTNALGEALQDVWDDHVGDTRTVPEFLTLTVEDGEAFATANFRRGNYVWRVAEHIIALIAGMVPAVAETRALAFMLYRTLSDRPIADLAWLTPEAKALLREIVHDLNPSIDTDRAGDPLTAGDLDELAAYADHEADMLDAPDHRDPDDQPTREDHAEADRLRALAARARRHLSP